MAEMKMLVGLGNPGLRYAKTRHNVGFAVVDALARRFAVEVKQQKFGARYGMVDVEAHKVLLLKPWQYMNLSGQAVSLAVGFYQLPLDNVMVFFDDMDLEPGCLRIRSKGSAGGHNGLADILIRLGKQEVPRCRVGIGRPEYCDGVGHVLGRPSRQERIVLDEAIDRAMEAAVCWMKHGLNRAMTDYNTR